MQMLAISEKWKTEIMAINPGHRNAKHAGVNQYGRCGVFALGHGALDASGTRSFGDGADTWGGVLTVANVKWFEMNFPVLYLFRCHAKDEMGASTYHGGTGGGPTPFMTDRKERSKGSPTAWLGLEIRDRGCSVDILARPASWSTCKIPEWAN